MVNAGTPSTQIYQTQNDKQLTGSQDTEIIDNRLYGLQESIYKAEAQTRNPQCINSNKEI
jgi:hypothetical protein